jgi:photosystem II stability/assembly factor-like uncharacterized protein
MVRFYISFISFLKASFFLSLSVALLLSSNLYGQQLITRYKNNQGNILLLYSGSRLISIIPVSPDIMTDDTRRTTLDENTMLDRGWALKFSMPGKVFKDVSFANTQVGYIVTELGSVYKSSDGGDTWTSKMNLGFPYYWYGVYALTPDTVVISGFNNQHPITEGTLRWTYDGGTTWGPDIILNIPVSAVGWLERVHFFNADTGIVINSFSGGVWYTATGGKEASAWTYVTVNSDLGWFAGNIDAQASGRVYATGIHFAQSDDFGLNWNSGPSADAVFDGGVDFLDFNNLYGWTGGGQISAPVSGWIHRTIDGGVSWSQRLHVFPYPIRALHFLDENRGWAVGGNLYDEAGGIYITVDGGLTWNLEVNTSAEMFSLEFRDESSDSIDVWCVGSTGGSTGFTGKLYKTRIGSIITDVDDPLAVEKDKFALCQNYPNPFNRMTTIEYKVGERSHITLKVYDIWGKEVATLVDEMEQPGTKSIHFDGSRLPGGIYYYQLSTAGYTDTKKFLHL